MGKKVIRRRIRRDEDGVKVEGDIQAVIAVNTEPGRTSVSSSSSSTSKARSPRRRRKGVQDDG